MRSEALIVISCKWRRQPRTWLPHVFVTAYPSFCKTYPILFNPSTLILPFTWVTISSSSAIKIHSKIEKTIFSLIICYFSVDIVIKKIKIKIIMIIISIYNNFLNYRQKWYFIDNKVNFKCYLQLISLKKSIQSKHYLQFPSIKKNT